MLLVTVQVAQAQTVYPYAKMGLSNRDAAVHVLNRFTFGPRPGEIEAVQKLGIAHWLEVQLAARDGDGDLNRRLKIYPELAMSDREINQFYLQGNQIADRARAEGKVGPRPQDTDTKEVKTAYRDAVSAYAKEHGLHDLGELNKDMVGQKLLRAVYGRNQLSEVMTDFWFNHFNVSLNSGARSYLLSYERDAIRPLALGHFEHLLLATAKHPAMLAYLNNAQSVANANRITALESSTERFNSGRRKSKAGLNENYGREVMELHTLGVDGGYTQHDVTELARALTGWTIYPFRMGQEKYRQRLEQGKVPGAVIEGDFLFRADQHDAGAKQVLNYKLAPGGGLAEGEQVLKMLARHNSTAHFISRKLAVRFVSDNPPAALVERLAMTFKRTHGDTRELIRTLVNSPEFWASAARGAKVKDPFCLLASSMRALNAEVEPSGAINYWLDRMGEPLYNFAPPTGFPDRAQQWVGGGTLTYRMNYGIALASDKIKGVKVNLAPFEGPPSESPAHELLRLARRLLPGWSVGLTVRNLEPLLVDQAFLKRLNDPRAPIPIEKPPQVSLVLGLLIGSPEFQQR
jgi:uncharacterized protein (DUF1800 family)